MALLICAGIPALAGCADGSGPARSSVTGSGTAGAVEVSAVPAPVGTATAVAFDRDDENGIRRNELGEPWRLDAGGERACAHAEFAFRAPETGDDLAAEVAALRSTVRASEVTALTGAVAALPAIPGAQDVRAVVAVCTTLGYQL